jgi:hypothetical protein
LVPNRIDGMDKLGCYVDQARLNGRTLFAALYRLAIPPRTLLRPYKVASKQRALGLVPAQPIQKACGAAFYRLAVACAKAHTKSSPAHQ